MTRLTVAIPTYNRSVALAETVRHLLPQLTPECKLLIVDNASDTPASDVLKPVLSTRPDVSVQFHRNRYNVGMCGNFMCCFELCDTEWLWILGDDNPFCPDAIAKIFRQLDSHPDCVFHNFVCPTLRKENRLDARKNTVETAGVEEFVRELDHFASIQFISLNVYRTCVFVPHFALGVDYAYSLHNFVAMVLMGLNGDRRACFTTEVLILDHGRLNKVSWSRIRLALASCTLLELPLSAEVRRCLGEKIVLTFFRLKTTATILLDELQSKSRSQDEVRYLFHQICARAYYYAPLGTRFQIAIYRFLFRFPGLSAPLRRMPLIKKMLFNEKR